MSDPAAAANGTPSRVVYRVVLTGGVCVCSYGTLHVCVCVCVCVCLCRSLCREDYHSCQAEDLL